MASFRSLKGRALIVASNSRDQQVIDLAEIVRQLCKECEQLAEELKVAKQVAAAASRRAPR
jgi:outer membrane murein-binding lipoprotein Lpp